MSECSWIISKNINDFITLGYNGSFIILNIIRNIKEYNWAVTIILLYSDIKQ